MTTHGKDGVAKIGTNTVAETRSWTYSETGDVAECSAMGDPSKEYKAGQTDGSGTLVCWWDPSDTTGQGAMTTGAEVTLNLYPAGAGSGETYYGGTVIITGADIPTTKDGIVERSFRFQGKLTEQTVT